MKFLLSIIISFSALSQQLGQIGLNQSYIFMDTGKAYTVRSYMPDNTIVPLFRIDDYFFDLNQIEEDKRKSNYFFDNEDNLYTVSSTGYMFKYDKYETDSKIKEYGETFFITKKGSVYVIDYNGNIVVNDKAKVKEQFGDKIKAQVTGANYIITKDNDVIMVNSLDGKLYPTQTQIELGSIVVQSNNYLTTDNGILYTFGFLTNNDGSFKEIISKIKTPVVNQISKVGGNFFFDTNNNIHTISFNGLYDLGNSTRQLQVKVSKDNIDRSQMTPQLMGSNYFIYSDGAVYIVDRFGYYYHLDTIPMRVALTSK